MPAHILTWVRRTVNTYSTHKNPHGCRPVGYNILSNSYTTNTTFYLTWSKVNVFCTLEMQLRVYTFPAILQTATGQNGNKADYCHRTYILKRYNNGNIAETLRGFTLWKPRWHQWSRPSSFWALYLLPAGLPIEVISEAIHFFVPASWFHRRCFQNSDNFVFTLDSCWTRNSFYQLVNYRTDSSTS